MMDRAVDDNARRYTACAILTAEPKGLLVTIAKVWFYYLLCPGMLCHYVMRHSAWIFLVVAAGHANPSRSLPLLAASGLRPFPKKLTTARDPLL
jgi:hypothetical protein